MKPLASLPPIVLLALCGCGGDRSPNVGLHPSYVVTPAKAEVATGGSVDLATSTVDGQYDGLEATVREGSAGGSVAIVASAADPTEATYTAPPTPGTYHVDVRFLFGKQLQSTQTSTIAVVAAP